MPSMSRVPAPLPRQQAEIRQWCKACQRCTPSVIIEGVTCCAVCQPRGPHYEPEVED